MKIKIAKTLYSLTTVIVVGVGAVLMLQMINFTSEQVNNIFEVDEAKIEAKITSVDMDGFKSVAERLEIMTKGSAEESAPR